jgi:hypothetical protein
MLEVVRNIEIPRAYIGLGYMPMRPVSSAELTWDVLKDEQNLGGLYSIDGKVMPGHDPIFGQMFSDVCRIGASRVIAEDEYRKLRDPGMVGVETGMVADLRAEATRKVAEKLAACNREVDVTIEYLIMSALQGYIAWPPPGLNTTQVPGNAKLTVDFNFPSNHKVRADNTTIFGSGTALWSDETNCDVAKQFQIIAEKLEEDAGISADNLDVILPRRAVRLMGQTAKLRDIVKYTDARGLLSFGAVRDYLAGQYGVNLVVYNGQYTYRSVSTTNPSDITINRVRIVPSNKVLFVPRNVKIGDFATSPAKANNWQTGKFTWNKEETNPWRDEIGVGINGFPRVTKPECVFVLQVEEDPTGLDSKK